MATKYEAQVPLTVILSHVPMEQRFHALRPFSLPAGIQATDLI